MKKTLLISLVSEQTLPNVQLIKELKKDITNFLFISTKAMELRGNRKWIEQATDISNSSCIEVGQFSFDNIIEQLDLFDFSIFNRLIVNLTGGTKVMTLVANEYFKELGAEIYYITGQNDNEYIKLYPGRKKQVLSLSSSITIDEYLKSYGFIYKKNEMSKNSFEYTKSLFEYYCNGLFNNFETTLSFLRGKRNNGVKANILKEKPDLLNFLNEIKYPVENELLSSTDVKYLTGDWFEEYIGLILKEELKLSDEEIMIGVEMNKTSVALAKNDKTKLLGEQIEDNNPNEFDIVFINKNKFYIIECKTSIINKIPDPQKEWKEVNILGETIYKADSLKNKFGSFANTTIVTLTGIKEYIESSTDTGTRNNRLKQISEQIDRANLSGIKLLDKSMLTSTDLISNLIK